MSKTFRVFIFGLLSSIGLPAYVQAAPPSHYKVVDLGTLGGQTSNATALNNLGEVTGQAETASGVRHAFLYQNNVMSDIGGTISGGASRGTAINDAGRVVMLIPDPVYSGDQGFIYSPSGVEKMPLVGAGVIAVCGINQSGIVSGTNYAVVEVGSGWTHVQQRPFLYISGTFQNLGCLWNFPGAESYGYGMNDYSQVVGTSETPSAQPYVSGPYHAFLYSSGSLSDLGTLGGASSSAIAIDNAGQVVGSSDVQGGGRHAFSYVGGVMKDLGNFTPIAINNIGEIVGTTNGGNGAVLYANGVANDLAALTVRPAGWNISDVRAINDKSQIAASMVTSAGVSHAVRLDPIPPMTVKVAADVDGNGTISFADASPDLTSTNKPFRFWLNDDHDGIDPYGDPKGGDLGDAIKDSNDLKITHLRDLEDFALLNLEIIADGATTISTGSKMVLSLTGSGSVHVVPISRPGLDYLTDETYASNLLTNANLYPVSVGTDATIPLDGFLNYTQTGDRTLGLLFEGVESGDFTISGQIVDQSGAIIAKVEKFYVQLRSVKEMYDHFTVDLNQRGAVTPEGENPPVLTTPIELSRVGDGLDDSSKPYVLFVHGWRLKPWERERFAETAFKRLYWAGFRGTFGLFSWPTKYVEYAASEPHNYDESEFNAWQAAEGLNAVLDKLETGASPRVRVLAHSMGNVVASEALRLRVAKGGSKIRSYVASQAATVASAYNPAVPTHYFSETLGLGAYPNADLYRNWPSPAGLFQGIKAGIADGGVVNFCNPSDFALSKRWSIAGIGLVGTWTFNQSTKPDAGLGYGYLFGSQQFGFLPNIPLDLSNPLELYSALAFAAPATSSALGAEPTRGGEVSAVVRLDDGPLWYGEDRWDHSAEFLSTIHRQLNYWRIFLGNTGVISPPVFPLPPPIVGMYSSNIIPTDPKDCDHSGVLSLILNRSLTAFSMSFSLGSKTYSSTGSLPTAGHWEKTFTPKGAPSVVVKLDLSAGHLRGTVTTNGVVSTVQGETVGVFSKKAPSPNAGLYTILLNSDDGAVSGTGYARLIVATTGSATVVGVLPDGTPFSSAGKIQESNSVTVKALLYRNAGGILGKLRFSDETGVSDADGVWVWHRPANAKATFFPLGINTSMSVLASRYSPTLPLLKIDTSVATQTLGNLMLSCSNGGLSADIARPLWLSSLNKVAPAGPAGSALTATLNAKTGLISGKFVYPPTGKSIPFAGALFQKQQIGAGFFKTTTSVGNVSVEVTHPLP